MDGNVTTGGSYDAYTGNATRSVTDLAMPGTVGEIPLHFTRTFVSRGPLDVGMARPFGSGGLWRHNYQYHIVDNKAGTVLNPTLYAVTFPDGRQVSFVQVSGQTYWRGPLGTTERLELVSGSFDTGGTLCVHQGDGSRFEIDYTVTTVENKSHVEVHTRHYLVTRLYDRHGRKTDLIYGAGDRLEQIVEPGGRFIGVSWTQLSTAWLISEVQSSNRETVGGVPGNGDKVTYSYTQLSGAHYGLTGVAYPTDKYQDSAGVFQGGKAAVYTYASTGSPTLGWLLQTAVDPHYAGAMTRIKYAWASGVNGMLQSESYYGTGGADVDVLVSSLSSPTSTTRVETRGDLVDTNLGGTPNFVPPTRTFTYSGGRLVSVSNFQNASEVTSFEYLNGFLRKVTDQVGRQTLYDRESVLGKVTRITHLADNKYKELTYTSTANPYFIATERDENGKVTTYTRNARGQETRIDYPDSGYEEFTYNEDGLYFLPATSRNKAGGLTTYTYANAPGQSGRFLNTAAWVMEEGRMATGVSVISPNTLLTSVTITGTGIPSGETRIHFYDMWGRVVSSYNSRLYPTLFNYDRTGRLLTTQHNGQSAGSGGMFSAAGMPVTSGYDQTYSSLRYDYWGNLYLSADQLGKPTTTTFDAYRRPLTVTDPTGRVTTYLYRANNNTTQSYLASTSRNPGVIQLPGNGVGAIVRQTHFYYSPDGWVRYHWTGGNTAEHAWKSYEYNAKGEVRYAANSTGLPAQETRYDSRGFVQKTIDGLGNETTYGYDFVGNLLTKTLPPAIPGGSAKTVTYTYDNMNRKWTETDESNNTTTWTYFPSGTVQTVTDPRSKVTTFEQDAMGRTTKTIHADSSYETMTFGLDGLLTGRRSRAGSVWSSFTYDHRGRLFHMAAPSVGSGIASTPGREYNYDAVGRIVRLTNNTLYQITWNYDDAGRVTKEAQYAGDTGFNLELDSQYDAAGRLSRQYYPLNYYYVDYTYNARDRVASVQSNFNAGGADQIGATFGYAHDNQLNRITRNNGVETTMGFDNAARVSYHHHQQGGSNVAKRSYGYENVNRLAYIKHDVVSGSTGWEDGRGTQWWYYDNNQVQYAWHECYNVNVTHGPVGGYRRDETFVYDAAGNRTSSVNSVEAPWPGMTYGNNDLNQLTGTYLYSPVAATNSTDGNLATYQGWTYTYDAEGLLVSVSDGSATMSMAYDPLGRVVKRTFPDGSVRRYFYKGHHVLTEFDGTNFARAMHVYAPGVDHVLGSVRWATGSPAPYLGGHYRLYDARNTVTHLLNAGTGAVQERYGYDTFGVPRFVDASGNTTSATSSAFENRTFSSGRYWFHEVGGGLYDHRARYMNPRLGRFLQVDPIRLASDVNMYRYARNSPQNYTDPSGLGSEELKNGIRGPRRNNEGMGGGRAVADLINTAVADLIREAQLNGHEISEINLEVWYGSDSGGYEQVQNWSDLFSGRYEYTPGAEGTDPYYSADPKDDNNNRNDQWVPGKAYDAWSLLDGPARDKLPNFENWNSIYKWNSGNYERDSGAGPAAPPDDTRRKGQKKSRRFP